LHNSLSIDVQLSLYSLAVAAVAPVAAVFPTAIAAAAVAVSTAADILFLLQTESEKM